MSLNGFQLGIPQHQPLAAFAEVHLHPGLSPGTFEVQDHAVTEDGVTYGLAKAEAGLRNLAAAEQVAATHRLVTTKRTADAVGQPHFLNQAFRNLAYEARHLVVGLAAIQASGFGKGHYQILHGPGDADVGQSTLFLEAAGFFQAHLVREQAFFHAHQEHVREFQALGAVQGHQLNAVFVLVGLGIASLQRRVTEESCQWRQIFVFFAVFEVACSADQLLEVFYPGLAFLAFFRFVIGDQPRLLDDGLGHQVQRHIHALGGEVLDQLDKRAKGTGRTTGQAFVGHQLAHRFPHRHIAVARMVADCFDGFFADTTGWHVDDPFQRGVIAPSFEQPQVSHGVLDFGAFEEALTAIDTVWDALAQQSFFQNPRLGVGTIQNRDIAARQAGFQRAFDGFDNVAGFVMFVERGVQIDRFAFAAIGPEFFAQAPGVVGDQGVGSLQDTRGGAIVLFQTNGFGVGEVFGILVDVLDFRAAPAVNRLVIVAHHHQAVAALGQQAQPGVLHGVGVLELVHQNVPEALLIVRQQPRMVPPQIESTQQQLGEVDNACAQASGLVGFINAAHGRQEQVAAGLNVLWTQAFVFLPVDEPLGLTGRPALFVQTELADHPLDQPLLVVAVENLERLAQARFLPVRPQQAVRQAVEGTDPHAGRVDTHQLLDALAHLGSGLVGEGHRQDGVGRGVFDLDQPGDTVHQHSGFTGTSTGQDQLTTHGGCYSLALGIVEGVQQKGEIIAHQGILGGGDTPGKLRFALADES
ncbi:hypothetical protein EMIT0196MI5_30307 [Pseudomonas sp. IT-196MI5]